MSSKETLQWALEQLASAQSVMLDPLRLRASVMSASLLTEDPYALLTSVCGLNELDAPVRLAKADAAHLPLLCHLPDGGWGVAVDVMADGSFLVTTSQGAASVPAAELDGRCVIVRCQGAVASVVDAEGPGSTAAHFGDRVRTVLRLYRSAVLEACMASLVIGLLALATSLFSMQVYDRVIPTHGEYTLYVLAAGVTLSILFELAMKVARARVMDHVVVGVDARLSRDIFQRLLQLRIDQLPPSLGSLAGQVRAYEQVRSFYTASTLFTLIDLPMGLVLLAVVAVIATPSVALVLSLIHI